MSDGLVTRSITVVKIFMLCWVFGRLQSLHAGFGIRQKT